MNVLEMDRWLARAIELGRGIRFETEDVALLVSIGLPELLASARNNYLKERARCLTIKTHSTAEETSFLDFDYGRDGKPRSSNLYIWWYDSAAGRHRSTSTRTADAEQAKCAIDAHYLK